jgi:Domain of unknown function (DUF3597)
MSIFGKIKDMIFNRGKAKAAAAAPAVEKPIEGPAPTAAPNMVPAPAATPVPEPIDIEAVLEELAAEAPQKLNWRTSIVDLMKLVGMDSSLSERRELADELGFDGDKGDTATMNMWLHKKVMQALAENGGKVPAEFLD